MCDEYVPHSSVLRDKHRRIRPAGWQHSVCRSNRQARNNKLAFSGGLLSVKHLLTRLRKEEACIIGCLAPLLITVLATQVRAQTESVLHTFAGSSEGGAPYAGLLSDRAGNLYGTTMQYGDAPCAYPFGGCGTVFELVAVQEGGITQWTFEVLYTFRGGTDGADPASTLVFDSSGNLYGTTTAGGTGCGGLGCGTVFELARSGSEWYENVLYRFTGGPDGRDPVGSLTLDPRGNLYGTTAFGGDNNC